jgi:ribonuclease HI
MELTALIKALEEIKTDKYPVEIWTDSKYVLDGITKWIKNWKQNNRKTSNKQDVKNKELWQKLDNLMQKYQTEIHWVKAHASSKENNFVDKIARQQANNLD